MGKRGAKVVNDNVKLVQNKEELNHPAKDLVVYEFVSKDYDFACKSMKPEFKQLSRTQNYINHAEFLELDADKFKDVAGRHGVDTYPTYVLLNVKDGMKEVGRVSGINKEELENCIKRAVQSLN